MWLRTHLSSIFSFFLQRLVVPEDHGVASGTVIRQQREREREDAFVLVERAGGFCQERPQRRVVIEREIEDVEVELVLGFTMAFRETQTPGEITFPLLAAETVPWIARALHLLLYLAEDTVEGAVRVRPVPTAFGGRVCLAGHEIFVRHRPPSWWLGAVD